MKVTYISLLIFCCLISVSTDGIAQLEEIAIGNTFGVGARAMGMGGAFLGVADDFTALYWNPAGLAQIGKFEFYGGFAHNGLNTDTQFTRGRVTASERSKTRPNSIGLVYPFYATTGGLAIALGYNRPQNFDSRAAIQGIDPSSGTVFSGLDVDETESNSGGMDIWSFGVGVFISKNILLGGSLDFWYGTSLNELDSAATDISNVDSELANFSFRDTIDREYHGISGRVGILARIGEYVTLGVTALSPMNLGVDELWRQETIAVFDDGERESDAEEGGIGYDIERPFEFGGGVAVKLLEKRLTVASDFQFSDWTQTKYTALPSDDIDIDHFEEFYDSTIQIRVGAEYRIPTVEANVRVGYFRDPIPFTGKDIDSDRDFLTFGLGKVFDEVLKFDVAYMRGSWKQSSDSLSTDQTSNRVFVSAAYRY
jgi:long-subunit fatty acid transport protein